LSFGATAMPLVTSIFSPPTRAFLVATGELVFPISPLRRFRGNAFRLPILLQQDFDTQPIVHRFATPARSGGLVVYVNASFGICVGSSVQSESGWVKPSAMLSRVSPFGLMNRNAPSSRMTT